MQYIFLTLAAAASYASAQTSASPIGAVIPVGQQCTPGGTPCALGAQCYSTNSGLQTICGNFQASCTSNQQCAFNTCSQGACSGVVSSSASPSASASATPIGAVIPVGQQCTPGGTPCALGAQCYATNSMLQTICGNFQAACTSNQQCAVNTCNNGFCNGVLSSSSAASGMTTASRASSASGSASASSSASPIGAVIPVGQQCTVGGTMCALGAQCYSTNSGLQTICGNFQASCTSNQQCAFNTCQNGSCSGVKPSGASTTPSGTTPTSGSGSTSTRTGSSTPPTFTAAASRTSQMGGLAAFLFAAVAWL